MIHLAPLILSCERQWLPHGLAFDPASHRSHEASKMIDLDDAAS
jgi:hypothetical protein